MTQALKDRFKSALEANDLEVVKEMVKSDRTLVGIDLRPATQQTNYGYEFPLNIASKLGHYELCKILLDSGADPDSNPNVKEKNEMGVPICNAIENRDYKLANLLLDAKANTYAYAYCDTPMIETLYHQARAHGVSQEIIKYGFSSYLDYNIDLDKYRDSHESINVLVRVLERGVIPNISAIVRDEYHDLIKDLLAQNPHKAASSLCYPKGNNFERIVGCASWFGYPKILKMAMDLCPQDFNVDVAAWSINRSIRSHNRDGTVEDYIEMITCLLEYLKAQNALDRLNTDAEMNPYYLIAEHFCWPSNYGYKNGVSPPEDIIKMTQLFLDYGYDNYNKPHAESGLTPAQKAAERIDHKGMHEFVTFVAQLN